MGGLPDGICKLERQKAFSDVSRKFRVIPDDTMTVVADQKLLRKLHTGELISPGELQRGSLHIGCNLIKRRHLTKSALLSLSAEQYDDFIGYMKSLI